MPTAHSIQQFDAVLFDLDGVLTPTANIHAACWKRVFDEFLEPWAEAKGIPFQPFERPHDYLTYVDGKHRYQGVKSFLASRNIQLPDGEVSDAPNQTTVCGIGNSKDGYFGEILRADGIEAYPGSVALVRALREHGVKLAVVSSSHHCQEVLQIAGIEELFDQRMDGAIADRLQLAGKPSPETFLKAGEQLGVEPGRAVVVEDAIAGVQAGRAGHFGLVIGVARADNEQALRDNGADVVVHDLSECLPD